MPFLTLKSPNLSDESIEFDFHIDMSEILSNVLQLPEMWQWNQMAQQSGHLRSALSFDRAGMFVGDDNRQIRV